MNKANCDWNSETSGNYFDWKKVRIILLTIILGISGVWGQLVQGGNHAYAAVSEWEAVGETGLSVSGGAYWYTKMVVYDGIPYIAFTDVGNAQKATVMKYEGNNWVTVGNAGFSAGTTAHLSLQVYEGTPYLAYVDGGNANKATVMKYNGSNWETVGNAGLSAGGVDYTSLYVHEGTPYLAYKDGGHSNKATVMKFNGSVWEPVGSVGFSAGESLWLSMHMDNGIPYVAFSDNGDSQKPFVMKYNETNLTWETVGGAALSANVASHISLYVSDGSPYVSYRDGGNANKATVMKYNGNSWETVGNAGFSTGGVNFTSLHVNEGTPYVAYNDSANASKATLMMLNGSAWEPVGNDGFSANAVYYTSLYIDDGTPYVVYHDVGNYRNVVVMKAMKKFTVNYDANGASLGRAPSGSSYGNNTSVTVLNNTGNLVKTGYSFAGWNTAMDGSGTDYAAGDTYTMGAADVTLYAHWSANSYTVSYDGNGAISGSAPNGGSHAYNTSVTVLGNTGSLVKTGHTFAGWNTAADGSGTDYTAGGTYMMGAAGVTLYAQWTIGSFLVAYDGNGSTAGSTPSGGSYAYNTGVTVPGNTGSLVKTGHTFAGWNTAEDGGGTDYAAGGTYMMGAAGVTFYAQWTVNSYTVSYDVNGAISGSAPNGGSYAYNTGVTVPGNTGSLVKAWHTFAGWNTSADGSGTNYAAGSTYTVGAAGVILYAQWAVNSYTLAYDGNGAGSGSAPNGGSYAYNTSVTVRGNTGSLVKTGHTFAGWNTAADGSGTDYAAGDTHTMGASGVTLYAKWTVNSYTVSYDGNGAISGSAPSGGSYAYNTSVTVLGNTGSLVKTGHTFAEWNTMADGSGTNYASGGTYMMGAAGLTFYAKWMVNSYTLTYDGNGASSGSAPSGGSYAYNTGAALLGNTGNLVKTGYTFAGWNTAADGSGTGYAAGGTFMMGATGATLYAQWTIANYTVAYDGNGETTGNAPNGGSYAYNTSVTVLGNTGSLLKTGHTFAGWNTAADGSGTDYTAGDTYTMGASGVILYAQWTANSYLLAYNGNSASLGSVPSGGSYAYNTGVVVLGNTGSLVKVGYTFAGWNTAADGSGVDYAEGSTYTMGVAGITLYAQWRIGIYALAYEGNGATSGSAPSGGNYEYNAAIAVLGNTGSLVKTGYTFAGWNTAGDGSGMDYAAGVTYTMGAAGVVLYAQWTIGNYTLSYDGNGAISGSTPTGGNYDYNTGVTVLGNTGSLVKTGYTFAGWNTMAEGSGIGYVAGETHAIGASGVTLYAQWTLDSHIVRFDSNGGASVTSQTVSYGSNAFMPIGPTKNGYNFEGWYTNNDLTDAFEFDTAITGDITLYAKWKQASSTGSSSGTTGSSQNEEITVYVKDGEHVKVSIDSTVVITRTADSSGKKKDKATFTAIEAAKTVEQLKAIGSYSALLVVPDLGDKVSELLITLPSESSNHLAKGDIGLNIATTHAWLKLPVDAMKELKESTFFRITPLKDEEEQRELSARAALSTAVSAEIGRSGIKMIGVPVGFETNLKDRMAILELPLVNTGLNKEQLSYLGVYMERSDGKVELIRGKIAYDDVTGDPVIRIVVSKFSVFNTFAVVYSAGFRAIKEDAFTKAYITGYADSTFHPGNSVTRAEMAALLARAFSGEKALQYDRDYSDVRSSHWAAAAIEEVTKLGLMNGFTDGTFKPAQMMTRGEMAAIVIRLLTSAASGEEGFTDTAGHWADMAIKSVKAAGMMNGYADGTFRPNQAITRAEAVVIINRLLGRQPLTNLKPAFTDVPEEHWAYGQIQAASIDHLVEE